MSSKEELVKAFVHVRKTWANATGGGDVLASADVLGHSDVLVIPVTRLDISDHYFVEVTFYPRALEHQPAKSIKAFIPKEAVILIVELKSPDAMSALGYKKIEIS
jgi:hypothetical protein